MDIIDIVLAKKGSGGGGASSAELNKKVDKNQGEDKAGMALVVGDDGMVGAGDILSTSKTAVTTVSDESHVTLSFIEGEDANLVLDPTLKDPKKAAPADVVGQLENDIAGLQDEVAPVAQKHMIDYGLDESNYKARATIDTASGNTSASTDSRKNSTSFADETYIRLSKGDEVKLENPDIGLQFQVFMFDDKLYYGNNEEGYSGLTSGVDTYIINKNCNVKLSIRYVDKTQTATKELMDNIVIVHKDSLREKVKTLTQRLDEYSNGIVVLKTCTHEVWFTNSGYGDSHELQGVCTDGTYMYYCMHGRTDTSASVVGKVKVSDGTLIMENNTKSYGHANGICYVQKDNTIRIAKLDTDGTIFILDAETLEYVSEYTLKDAVGSAWERYAYDDFNGIGAIGYAENLDRFVYLVRKNTNNKLWGFAICTYDGLLEKLIKCNINGTNGGLYCDEHLIYMCVKSGTNNNVYYIDYDGNVLGELITNINGYIEGYTMVDDVAYVSSSNDNIYKLTATNTAIVNPSKFNIN